jgi:predicted nucleic acid-binding protein
MFVFDATPLIYLAKAERLSLLSRLDASRLIPQRVYEEVVTVGLDAGYPDARRIEQSVEEGTFDVVSVPETTLFERLSGNPNVSDADVAVLALAADHGATAVMDDAYGRDIAAVEAIETRGTAYLVLSLVRDDELEADDARETLEAMLDAGWHCSPSLYSKLLSKLEELAVGGADNR